MFGGTAQKYCKYEIACEPYKKGNTYYVKVIHPASHVPIEVRWYTDKVHADLMPKKAVVTPKRSVPKQENFYGSIFGFQSRDSKIVAIREKDISKEEQVEHFLFNWTKGGKWLFNTLFGGIWFAPADVDLPPVQRSNKYFEITWPEWVAEGQRVSLQMNKEAKGFWFSLD